MSQNPFEAFDCPEALRINKARMDSVKELILELKSSIGIHSVLDAGCGVGHLSKALWELGIPKIIGIDARRENVEEAQKRHSFGSFRCVDVEDLPNGQSFDLVFCFGLLYHLENPMRALRNVRAVTGKVLLLETMINTKVKPTLLLMDELRSINQGVRYLAFYPSESCVAKMLEAVGFPFLYRLKILPDHPNFRRKLLRKRARTIVVASTVELKSPHLIK
jgi:SAM-dependent methyltransferase